LTQRGVEAFDVIRRAAALRYGAVTLASKDDRIGIPMIRGDDSAAMVVRRERLPDTLGSICCASITTSIVTLSVA
jgi:hypothetical protein